LTIERKNPQEDRILVLDFGSQYTQLIARRIREIGVYCEIRRYDVCLEQVISFAPRGIILSGGPETVTDSAPPRPDIGIYALGVPLLGVCYGMQVMAHQLGGQVSISEKREFGLAKISPHSGQEWLGNTTGLSSRKQEELDVWMSHSDKVMELPAGFDVAASSANAPMAAIVDHNRHFFGLQFHPEVTHTSNGASILEHFLVEVCKCSQSWISPNVTKDLINKIKEQVCDDKVLLGLSGGVDSAVVAGLLHQAIGDQLTCIFVDNGLLRLNESAAVMEIFQNNVGIDVRQVNAEDRFLSELVGVSDPEEKRKIIGRVFIEVFQDEASKIRDIKWLAQGTIYPDIIESAGHAHSSARVIKSHHNVGGLPASLNLKLLEPLSELFKDEVRLIGRHLGMPRELVYRHPFPGPGLGVRILGEVRKEYAEILRRVDHIFLDELRRQNLYDKVSQAFAVFLPIKSVGVVGDNRAYNHVVVLRAVETTDFMTADWKQLPYEFLAHVSTRIINEVSDVGRVTYDISSKPPATIEWE